MFWCTSTVRVCLCPIFVCVLCLSGSSCVFMYLCVFYLTTYSSVCLSKTVSVLYVRLCPWVCTLYFVPVCVFFAFKVHSSSFTRFRSCFWRFRNKIFPTIFSPDVIFFFNSRPFFYVVFTLIKLSGLEVSHQPPPEIHSKTQTDTGNQAQTINHSIRVADPERLEAEIRIPLFNIVTDPDPKIRVV